MRRIYTASSWKNERTVRDLAVLLREWGHEVYCFAERGADQYVFRWDALPDFASMDGITCLQTDSSRRAFLSDKCYLDWADTCLLLNPAGRDAHLEAGYIKGRGGKLFILGAFPQGEFSNMYHLADGLFRIYELHKLKVALDGVDD